MTKIIAKVGDTVVAESEKTVRVEGNYYFPPEDVRLDMFKTTETHTHCPWKGEASYYTISVNDQELVDAAWYYPETISEIGRAHV